jgi:hypothetical protein
MTRTEERLADALGAAARAVREDALDLLIMPERRLRRRPTWVAPVAAAAGLLLAVGLGSAVSGHMPGTGHAAQVATDVGPPPRYYVDTQYLGTTVVRATATGAVTATVPVTAPLENPQVFGAADGEFFIFGYLDAGSDPAKDHPPLLYRFRLTGAGQVTALSAVPGSSFSDQPTIEAAAASPDGSKVAFGLFTRVSSQIVTMHHLVAEIVVIDTATGRRTVWQGGMASFADPFRFDSLSWTNEGELAFLVQFCQPHGAVSTDSTCPGLPKSGATRPKQSEVWVLDADSAGGRLDSGRMVLSQSAQFPDIEQAVISPDGSTLTAIVVNQEPVFFSSAGNVKLSRPGRFSVDQIWVANGTQLSTLYQGSLRWETWLQLSSDGSAGHWLIAGNFNQLPVAFPGSTFNGWIADGRLTPLQPRVVGTEAWSAPPPATPAPVASQVVRQPTTAGAPPRYYVETDSDGGVLVRSTATGAVTATVGIPQSWGPLVTAAANGTFFVVAGTLGSPQAGTARNTGGPTLYQFRLTGAGRVTGLSKVPGGEIGTWGQEADSVAAAPDGGQVAWRSRAGRSPCQWCRSPSQPASS